MYTSSLVHTRGLFPATYGKECLRERQHELGRVRERVQRKRYILLRTGETSGEWRKGGGKGLSERGGAGVGIIMLMFPLRFVWSFGVVVVSIASLPLLWKLVPMRSLVLPCGACWTIG